MSVSAVAALLSGALLGLLAVAAVSARIERRHYASLRAREQALARLPAVTFRQIPEAWAVDDMGVVAGSVVMSPDLFGRLLAGLRAIAGGRVARYESLLDRARREAILRCKEAARERGFQAVVNLRLETTRIPSAGRGATAGVEVFAFGTGLELRRDPR